MLLFSENPAPPGTGMVLAGDVPIKELLMGLAEKMYQFPITSTHYSHERSIG